MFLLFINKVRIKYNKFLKNIYIMNLYIFEFIKTWINLILLFKIYEYYIFTMIIRDDKIFLKMIIMFHKLLGLNKI